MATDGEPPSRLRTALAFDEPVRQGLELVRAEGLGITVVLGHHDEDEQWLADGRELDEPLNSGEILRAAHHDGALVLSDGWDRIVRERVTLRPGTVGASRDTEARGTRHDSAGRYAEQTGRPVAVVSEERGTITLYLGDEEFELRDKKALQGQVRDVLSALGTLSRQVPSEPNLARAHELFTTAWGHLAELGSEGRWAATECALLAESFGLDEHRDAEDPEEPPSRSMPSSPTVRGVGNTLQGGMGGGTLLQAQNIHVSTVPQRPADVPRPQQLPSPSAHFVGREKDLARVVSVLTAESTTPPVCVVDGAPGSGKTALAVQAAWKVLDRFPDGVLYADLGTFRGPTARVADPAETLVRFLRDLGAEESSLPQDLDGLEARYRSLLRERRCLVVLDDAHSASQVRHLMPDVPTCGLVVTGRTAMSGLVARRGATPVHLSSLVRNEAVGLLTGFLGVERDGTQLRTLAELCGHHPLALCIAGASGAGLPPNELAAMIERIRERRLDGLSDPLDPEASVRAAFTASYEALPPDQRRTFRIAGLYPGPTLSEQAAEALFGYRPDFRWLESTNLVERTGCDHQLHALLRTYAKERAIEEETIDERRATLRRVLTWFLHTAESHDQALAPWRPRWRTPEQAHEGQLDTTPTEAERWFEREIENLAASVEAALDQGEHELAWQVALAPSGYFFSRKPWATWTRVQRAGLEAARHLGDRRAQAWLCDGLGVANREQGRYVDALEYLTEAVTRFAEAGDSEGLGEAQLHLAQVHRDTKDLDEARKLSDAALVSFEAAGADHGGARALNLIGGVHAELGELRLALEHTRLAAEVFTALGDEHGRAWAVNNVATVLVRSDAYEEAVDAFYEVVEVRERIDRYGLAFTLRGLADALDHLGREDEARNCRVRALAIFEEIGDPRADRLRASLDR
ncbi:tetratricopeptide repeat protein [Nocardiopsis sp. HNM0947]|uniref:Tetratricopeptide repeat protein n=1 Tax=Nocardiopsis coralli TaxID=2772213 RepID=A0ABR9PBX8_9ACTN|nr:tetratricopeptide repeat protein [Nocardiopsis coralli]MBE3001345.1 tetratricopeptide repeat protein [Nocardiopsis coralli]